MDYLAPDGPVYQAGTLSGNPVAMKMGLNTLNYLKDHPEVYTNIENLAKRLEKGLQTNIKKTGVKATVNRYAGMTTLFFTEGPVTDFGSVMTSDTDLYSRYFAKMLDDGNLMPPSQFEGIFISAAHTADDIDKTVACNLVALTALQEEKND
jgi:glutamate-1-semialdehyde 2,1-aminomutase